MTPQVSNTLHKPANNANAVKSSPSSIISGQKLYRPLLTADIVLVIFSNITIRRSIISRHRRRNVTIRLFFLPTITHSSSETRNWECWGKYWLQTHPYTLPTRLCQGDVSTLASSTTSSKRNYKPHRMHETRSHSVLVPVSQSWYSLKQNDISTDANIVYSQWRQTIRVNTVKSQIHPVRYSQKETKNAE